MPDEVKEEFVPKRAMVVTPHPDDMEIGVGGTIAKWIAKGTLVTLVVATNGDKGSPDLEMTSERLAAIRQKEQRAAGAVLGVHEIVFLPNRDGELEDSKEFRGQIVRELRRTQPELVLTVDPYRTTFYWHRDHRMCGQVVMDAVFPYARDHLYYPEHLKEGLKPHKTKFLYLWATDKPDLYSDIKDTLDKKIEALKHHASQMGAAQGQREFGGFLRQMAKRIGEAKGMEATEAFRVVEMFG